MFPRNVSPLEIGTPAACFFSPGHYTGCMKNDVLPVQIRGILPANSGCALFVGNDKNFFVCFNKVCDLHVKWQCVLTK